MGVVVNGGNEVMPLITVITAVFNGVNCIECAIKSVLDQGYQNLQYIIVDGGSTDGTVDIIRKYESHLYCWVSERDRGISDAFNKGIALATGDIVGILNADDWYEANTLNEVAKIYRLYPQHVVHGRLRYWTNAETPYYDVGGNDALMERLMSVMHPTVFVPRCVYEHYGMFLLDYRRAMDYELIFRFKHNGVGFIYVDKIFANMMRGGVSDVQWFKTQQEVFAIRNKYAVPLYKNAGWVVVDVLKIFIRQGLEIFGFDRVVEIARRYCSKIPKARL